MIRKPANNIQPPMAKVDAFSESIELIIGLFFPLAFSIIISVKQFSSMFALSFSISFYLIVYFLLIGYESQNTNCSRKIDSFGLMQKTR